MIPWLGSVTYEYWEIRHILAEILYKGSSQVTRGEKEEDDSRLVISWIERGGRFAISERVRWDINLEAETWSGGPPPRRRTMCFDERHLYTNRMYARRERERERLLLSLSLVSIVHPFRQPPPQQTSTTTLIHGRWHLVAFVTSTIVLDDSIGLVVPPSGAMPRVRSGTCWKKLFSEQF